MNNFDALLSIHFLVKRRKYNFTHSNYTALGVKSLICMLFSILNIFLAHINCFQDFCYRKDDVNLLANTTFPYKTLIPIRIRPNV